MKNIFISLFIISLIFSFALPVVTLAAESANESGTSNQSSNTNEGSTGSSLIKNPLSAKSVSELLQQILDLITQIGIVVVAGGIIYTGFLYVWARGNSSKIAEAHKVIRMTLIGSAIIIGAFAIVKVVQETALQLLS